MEKDIIRNKINKKLPFIKDKYKVKNIGIFGSYVRNEQKKGSDLDLLVDFTSPIGFFEFIRLENFLSKTLGKKVDLVSKNAVKPAVKKNILKETQYV